VICFVFVFYPGLIGGGEKTTIQFQLSFLLVGIWWFAFAVFSLRRLPKPLAALSNGTEKTLSKGYDELKKVWRQLKHIPVLKRFLFSFFFYNMGVQTVMLAATLYGKSELQIETTSLIVAILLIQLIAIPGAVLMAKLSNRIGNIQSLMVAVAIWIGICIIGYLLPVGGTYEFFGLAALVGFVMGGIQSLSRSTYSKLMPETKDTTSFFSFYDVTEKIAIVIGMFSFGYINELTGSQRNSVLALLVFFVAGLLLLLYTLRAKSSKTHEALYD
jgi:MFS transporter, UMF1 family